VKWLVNDGQNFSTAKKYFLSFSQENMNLLSGKKMVCLAKKKYFVWAEG